MTGLGQSIYVKGIQQGEQMLATLINKLSAQGRVDEALKVASDEELRKKLYKEFGMIE